MPFNKDAVRKMVFVDIERTETDGTGESKRWKLFSLRKKQEMKPHSSPPVENEIMFKHIWWLLPGEYLVTKHHTINQLDGDNILVAKHQCSIFRLVIAEDKSYKMLDWLSELPFFVQPPCECLK